MLAARRKRRKLRVGKSLIQFVKLAGELCGAVSVIAMILARTRGGEDAEAAAAFDTVGFEIAAIDGEDGGEGLAPGQVHESGIGEIHVLI